MTAADRHDPNQPDELNDHDRMAAVDHFDPAQDTRPAAFVPSETKALASPFDDRLEASDLPAAAHHGLIVACRFLPRGD